MVSGLGHAPGVLDLGEHPWFVPPRVGPLGALWLGRLADKRDAGVERRCLLWAIGGTVAGAVSPLGPTLLIFPVHLLSRMKELGNIIEWQSPSFSSGWARLFLIQVVLAVILLCAGPPTGRPYRWWCSWPPHW